MHFTVLVALAVVTSSVLGSTVVDAVSTAPAVPVPRATLYVSLEQHEQAR
jgi:hypothetical protein